MTSSVFLSLLALIIIGFLFSIIFNANFAASLSLPFWFFTIFSSSSTVLSSTISSYLAIIILSISENISTLNWYGTSKKLVSSSIFFIFNNYFYLFFYYCLF